MIRRVLQHTFTLLFMSVLIACSGPRTKLKTPDIAPAVALTGIDARNKELKFSVRINNRSRADYPIETLALQLEFKDTQSVELAAQPAITLSPFASDILQITLSQDHPQLQALLKQLRNKSIAEAPFTLHGTINAGNRPYLRFTSDGVLSLTPGFKKKFRA